MSSDGLWKTESVEFEEGGENTELGEHERWMTAMQTGQRQEESWHLLRL